MNVMYRSFKGPVWILTRLCGCVGSSGPMLVPNAMLVFSHFINNLETEKRAFFLSTGTTAFCSCVLVGLAGYWHFYRAAALEPTICYKNGSFGGDINPEVLKKLIVKNDKDTNREKYCGKVSDMLDVLVTKKTEEKYNSRLNPEYVSLNLEEFGCKSTHREGIKLHLQQISSHARPVQGKPTKVFWQTTSDSMEELKHLEKDGVIFVQKPGLYYVSSQLTTTVENRTISASDHQTVRHLVYRVSYGKRTEVVLLENEKSTCEMTTEMSELTSNVGAVFNLQKRDRIYVATSHPYHLVSGPSINYLSIHMIVN